MVLFTLLFAAFVYGSGQTTTAQVANIKATSNTSNKQIPTIVDWFDFKYVSTPQISPDGRYVAYRIRNTNWSANRSENKIEVLAVATGATFELTNFGVNYGIEWMPDGKHIAFISSSNGAPQIYLVPATGGADAVQLTNVETGVGSFDISPDASRIAFTTTDAPASEQKKDDRSGNFQIIGTPSSVMTHLWTIDLQTDYSKLAVPERITGGKDFSVTGYSWSHDSRRIAFSGSNSGEIYSAFRGEDAKSWARNDIYTVGVNDKVVKKIVGMKGSDFSPVWSPDDKQIAYMTSKIALGQEFNFNGILYIAVVSAEGGVPRVITEKFDESPGLIDWLPDGIYFSALQKTYNHLFKINPATKNIERVSGPNPAIYNEFSFTNDHKQAAFISETGQSLPEVYVSSLQKFEPKRLTSFNDQLKNFKHGSREVIEWKSSDGTPVQGVLIKPEDFDSSKKYPLLVVIHTGPTLLDQPSFNPSGDIYPIEPLVAKGALVLQVNYRGSVGYGENFRLKLIRSLGLPQYEDVISGVDFLISQGMVDRKRVGALGYSHGGYIAAFIATYSNRFKAVSVGGGVSDWRIFYTNSDAGPGMLDVLRATPWDDPDYYRQIAPLSYIKKATTPTLIQHGRLDPRAPLSGSFELYRGLKDQGVPVKMIVYDGVAHAGWNPRQYRAFKQHNYEWFSQWIWDEKASL